MIVFKKDDSREIDRQASKLESKFKQKNAFETFLFVEASNLSRFHSQKPVFKLLNLLLLNERPFFFSLNNRLRTRQNENRDKKNQQRDTFRSDQ